MTPLALPSSPTITRSRAEREEQVKHWGRCLCGAPFQRINIGNTEIPYPLRGLGEREVRFTGVIDADDMPTAVLEWC